MTCEARKYHWPPAPACDSHHVLPRAWQAHWVPAENPGVPLVTAEVALLHKIATVQGREPQLWDPRTVELCPNDHRGVHERIVRLMKHREQPGRDRLWAIATLALERYTAAGGSLDDLRAARLWGEQ